MSFHGSKSSDPRKAHCERPQRLPGVELRGMAHDAAPIEAGKRRGQAVKAWWLATFRRPAHSHARALATVSEAPIKNVAFAPSLL